MRNRNLLLAILVVPAAGCSWPHDFTLEDVERLKFGETTVEDAPRVLANSERRYTGVYYSSSQEALPPAPLSFVSWPLYLGLRARSYRLELHADERSVVQSATLEISEVRSDRVLLFFGPRDYRVQLTDDEIRRLRGLQERGVDVMIGVRPILCFGGVLGWESDRLDDYLGTGD
jgi:hypothetical protein